MCIPLGASCTQHNSEVQKAFSAMILDWTPAFLFHQWEPNGMEPVVLSYIAEFMLSFSGQLNVYTNGPRIETNFRRTKVYCPRNDQLDMIAGLKIPRLRSCAALVGHKIYVFGWYLHGGYLDTIEKKKKKYFCSFEVGIWEKGWPVMQLLVFFWSWLHFKKINNL